MAGLKTNMDNTIYVYMGDDIQTATPFLQKEIDLLLEIL